MNIRPAVAGAETTPPPDQEAASSGSDDREAFPSLAELAGTWASDLRSTGQGPMRFQFHLTTDGHLEIRGKPEGAGNEYYRSGPFVLEGDQLIASVINAGRPAHVRLRVGDLLLTIDETLAFHLRRQ